MKRLALLLSLYAFAFSLLFAARAGESKYTDSRIVEKEYDIFGNVIMPEYHYVVYELLADVSDEGGSSDLYKQEDVFWERFQGTVFVEDTWGFGINAAFSVTEQLPVSLSSLTFSKAAYDGLRLAITKPGLSIAGRSIVEDLDASFYFTRMSGDVLSELDDDWESLGQVENDYFASAFFSFALRPLMLNVFTQEGAATENTYKSALEIPVLHVRKAQIGAVAQVHNNSELNNVDMMGSAYAADENTLYVRVMPMTNKAATGRTYIYPLTAHSGASVYVRLKENISNASGTFHPTYTVVENTGSVDVDAAGRTALVLDTGESFIMEITLPPNVSNDYDYVSTLTAELRLAGSYVVQANTSKTFRDVDYRTALPADVFLFHRQDHTTTTTEIANYGLYSFGYTRRASQVNVSYVFDVTLMNYLNVTGEIANALITTQSPYSNNTTSLASTWAFAVTSTLDVPFGEGFFFRGLWDYYSYDRGYTATFDNGVSLYNSVDDNDDGDNRPGRATGSSRIASVKESAQEIPERYDKNGNGTLDYEEALLSSEADHPFFAAIRDYNFNFEADDIEDDTLPEYPYPLGTRGNRVNAGIFYETSFLEANVGAEYHGQTLTAFATTMNYLSLTFDARLLVGTNGMLRLRYERAQVEDKIPNPYINENGTEIDDPLLFTKSTVQTLFLEYFGTVGAFTFEAKGKLYDNYMVYEDANLIRLGSVGRVTYRETLVPNILTWKNSFKATHMLGVNDDNVEGFTSDNYAEADFLSIVSIKPGTVFTFDVFYNMKSTYNLANYLLSHDVVTYGGQVTGAFRYERMKVVANIALSYTDRTYKHPDASAGRDDDESLNLVVRIYSMW